MTNTPSLRANTSTGQGSLLGEHRPTPGVRLTLHTLTGGAVLLRHRLSAHAGAAADIAAHITHAGGVVSAIDWDDYHSSTRPEWIERVEKWIKKLIAEAAS